ncbi:DUF1353 domain-containing protein [Roseinatronobacter alkalisoli]|uniref:DUF1353 domain-containing protein n=1 Tax=Roseinatronobacter alkalisoli TaxID=3028235 RepID=A0ABT5TED6_9RHOB|nr:DUF1353 domain-containing protein [Roseinatronobacter sp. HJB301]MDD7973386.1 DUF1353 domain-containing protein [Roseinatronobacter sp. HJB301]
MEKMFLLLVIIVFSSHPARAEFSGQIVLLPPGCQKTAQCTLGDNFGYIDKQNIGWEADKGDVTDGASIPRWAQFFAGEPFEETYLPAAILHDHYSKSVRPVRGWYQTQKMFYEVLIASGVSESKAAILYAGVLIGSGKWLKAKASKPCPTITGVACINLEGVEDEVLIIKSPIFGTPRHTELFEQARAEILSQGLSAPIPVVELLRRLMPDDIFLTNTDGTLGGAQEF